MSLSDLPDDILGLISIRLNGFDNCSLWMASDSKLKQRLVDNAISDFDIKYTILGRFIWPGNFLKKLKRLSRLSLVVNKDVYHIPIENVELFPVETLKYLKLDCTNSRKILQQKFSTSSNDATGPASDDEQYYNIKDLYCNLEHFEFEKKHSSGSTTSRPYTFPIDLLHFLPSNLQTLSIIQAPIEVDKRNPKTNMKMLTKLLPHTLTALNISVSAVTSTPSLDFSRLPPNLTSLTTNALLREKSYNMIPKNLTHLHLTSFEYDIRKLAPFLPLKLRSLSIRMTSDCIAGDCLAHLQHLDYLETHTTSREPSIITKYPPNLKTCHGYFRSNQDLKIVQSLDNLSELLIHVPKISASQLSCFPQKLVNLSIFILQMPYPFEFFAMLPKSLLSLKSNLPIMENLSSLPEGIKELYLSCQIPIEIKEGDEIPQKLETLDLLNVIVPQSVLKALPPTLTFFKLRSPSINVDDEVIASLPRGLKTLQLSMESLAELNLTDASASLYPPNLEHLHIPGYEITDESVAALPRSLRVLYLLKNKILTDNCIKHLPRKLVDLTIPQCTGITRKCCKDLPEYLSCLGLSSCESWNEESLKDLPKYLKWFNVRPSLHLSFMH